MKTWSPEPVNGVRSSVSYEAYRGRLYVTIRHNGDTWSAEFPIGEMAHRIGLSGATLDAARARWAAVNAPKPERKQRNAAARAKERARDVKRKRAQAKARAANATPAPEIAQPAPPQDAERAS